MFTHLNHSRQVKHCYTQLWVCFSKLMGQGTSTSCRDKYNSMKKTNKKKTLSPQRCLLTSKVAGCFEARKIKGCCYSVSCDFCSTMHGTHELKFDFLIIVESVLRKRNTLNCIKGFSKAISLIFTGNLCHLEQIVCVPAKRLLVLVRSLPHSTLQV